MKLSIIIVERDRAKETEALVGDILKKPPACEFEIIVIDAGGEAPILPPQVRLFPVKSGQHFPLNKARNLAVSLAEGTHLVFLNCNLRMKEDSFSNLLRHLKTHEPSLVLGTRLKVSQYGSVVKTDLGTDAAFCVPAGFGNFDDTIVNKETGESFSAFTKNFEKVDTLKGFRFQTGIENNNPSLTKVKKMKELEPDINKYRSELEGVKAQVEDLKNQLAQAVKDLAGSMAAQEAGRVAKINLDQKIAELNNKIRTEYDRGMKEAQEKWYSEKARIESEFTERYKNLETEFLGKYDKIVSDMVHLASPEPTPEPNSAPAQEKPKTWWQKLFRL